MSDSYSQFAECIENITPEEAEWIETILTLNWDDENDRKKLLTDLGLSEDDDEELDHWPDFEWGIEADRSLYVGSEESFTELHLIWFIQAFIKRWRPGLIFKMTGAGTCNRQLPQHFGGFWLVIYKDGFEGGSTWEAVSKAADEIAKMLVISNKPE